MTTLLLATLVTLGADAEPLSAPKGPPPTLVFLNAKGDRVTMAQSVVVPVEKTVKEKRNVGGREVEVEVRVTELVTEMREVEMTLDKATFQTASGKKLTADEAKKRLAGGAIVALSSDGKAVDKNYLSALKTDTVIILLPGGIATDVVPLPAPMPLPAPAPGRIRPVPAPVPRLGVRPLPAPVPAPLLAPVPAPDR